jgi:peptide/nickel transport system permease protein
MRPSVILRSSHDRTGFVETTAALRLVCEVVCVTVFLLRRVVLGIAVLFIACSASFFLFASQYLPLRGTPLGSDYWRWLRGLPTGRSMSHGLSGPLLPYVVPAFGRTAALLGMTLVVVLVFALLIGFASAAARGSVLDVALRGLSYLGWAVPSFLLALVLQQTVGKVAGGSGLGWFPIAGWAGKCPGGLGIDLHTFTCPAAGTGVSYVWHVVDHLVLPAVAIAFGFVGLHARFLRTSLIESLDAPFATVARAKGLPERTVVLRHAGRNSLATFLAAILSDFGAIFGASLAVDWVFRLGGLGSLFVGILNVNSTVPFLDTYAVELLLLIGGGWVLLTSILGEVAVGFLDPRTELR